VTLDPSLALDLTARIAAFGSLVSTLELLAVQREFGPAGVFNRDAVAALSWRGGQNFARIDPLIVFVLVVQAVSSAALAVLGPFAIAGRLATAVCVGARAIGRWRRLLGGDGAEQITSLALIAVALAVLPVPGPARVRLAVAFIAGQLLLSYVTAGIAKLLSPAWRGGTALSEIAATETHGHPLALGVLRRAPRVELLLCWTIIVFECLIPALVLGPVWLAVPALAIGLAFHIGCAVTMGLNSFLWAFPATYPCVLAVRGWLWP